MSLARLAHFFGVSVEPCHRALPDAIATAEILVSLLGLAQERGARTIGDVVELAAPRARRLHGKRSLVAGAPTTPGVYLFRDANDTVLYVGKARDLRARLRSYFAGARQRPAVEAALGALARVEWRVLGSELEAALEELRADPRAPTACECARVAARPLRLPRAGRRRLARRHRTRALRADPEPASRTARDARARGVRRGRSPRRRSRCADEAAEARRRPPLRGRCARARSPRRPRGCRRRSLRARPAAEGAALRPRSGARSRASGARSSSPEAGSRPCGRWPPARPDDLEARAGLAEVERATPSFAPEHADELLVVSAFLRRPPPELRVVALDASEILAA